MDRGHISSYYRAALCALRFLEQRQPTGRRFGPDADARWSSFRGDLTTADRIDLLIRDADAQWPGALGARTVFALRGVAEDEPMGAGWESLDPVDAEAMWRAAQHEPAPDSPRAALTAAARCWEIALDAPGTGPRPSGPSANPGAIAPADKLVVAGPAAITAAVDAFARGQALDWADQVTVIATPPAHRQLAALAGALLNTARPTKLASPDDTAEPIAAPAAARLLVSPDADPRDAAAARERTAR